MPLKAPGSLSLLQTLGVVQWPLVVELTVITIFTEKSVLEVWRTRTPQGTCSSCSTIVPKFGKRRTMAAVTNNPTAEKATIAIKLGLLTAVPSRINASSAALTRFVPRHATQRSTTNSSAELGAWRLPLPVHAFAARFGDLANTPAWAKAADGAFRTP